MNYYERYMGDYQRDTGHLSLAEHGAYAVLLDTYYSTEQPLPQDLGRLYRVCRAMSKEEQAAVRNVAAEFFPVGKDGLRHNARADREIEEARPRMEAARENGKRGGRPRKGSKSTEQEPNGNPMGFQNGTQREPSSNPEETQQEPGAKAPQPHAPINQRTDADASVVVSVAADRLACPHQQIIDAWCELLPELPAPRVWTQTRMKHLQARWREQCKAKRWESQADGVAWFRKLFGYIRQSAFLMGESPRGEGHEAWSCTLPWAIEAQNFAKIIEGNYHREAA